jgi:hypothetical protein
MAFAVTIWPWIGISTLPSGVPNGANASRAPLRICWNVAWLIRPASGVL